MSIPLMWQKIQTIAPGDKNAMAASRVHWDSIAKPLHGLGRLEDMVVRIAGAVGSPRFSLTPKGIAVFCADNGVVAEGVTQAGPEVTWSVAQAMAKGRSSVCLMAKNAHADVFPVDIGMLPHPRADGLLDRNIRAGTRNLTKGAAMTREEAEQGLLVGFQLAEELVRRGYRLLAAGEMGIGNTTTAAAVTAVLLGCPADAVVGRGAGLSDEGLLRKRDAVQRGLACNRPDPADPVEVLRAVGGLDIAGMTGFYLGAAYMDCPVLLDGAISCAAALLAVRLCPNVKKAMLASHWPVEPCGQLLLRALGLEPVLDGRLHLGEGTGAVALMPLLDMALSVYQDMVTFDGMGIDAYQEDGAAIGERREVAPL